MLEVTRIRTEDTAAGATLGATLVCPGTPLDGRELWFSYPKESRAYLSSSANPWLATLLWPAMRLGQDLHIDAPVSPRLLEGTETLMDIMHQWDPRFERIQIVAEKESSAGEPGQAVASFFSGGVDSFHTVLKNTAVDLPPERRISHLIFAWGLDIDLGDEDLHGRVLEQLRESASELGCTLLGCSTNVRRVVPGEIVAWPMYYGSVLAGLALGLEKFWNRVLIPAPQTYSHLFPNGSHPLVDPLWSTESLNVVHDGAEVTRVEKVTRWVAMSDVALRHLRVCWENRNGHYNCGACEKCLRTMVSLELAGALGKCNVFARPLRYQDVAAARFKEEAQEVLMRQNYEAALAANADPQLIRALRSCLHPGMAQRAKRGLHRCARSIARRLRSNGRRR